MNNPLHAAYYADHALQQTVLLLENEEVAQDTFRARLQSPQIARRALPGQFFMVKIAGLDDPLIGRPLALYDTVLDDQGEVIGLDVVYQVGGKFTTLFSKCSPGQSIDLWGPLGNGFQEDDVDHLIMVAGGIGHTPFLALAREYLGDRRYGEPDRIIDPSFRVTLCYGVRSADWFAGVEDFQRLGVDVRLCTDDGSRGRHGLVTDLLREMLQQPEESRRIVCCGPEPMMQAVAKIAIKADVPCQVSLETPMACGIGICFSCVAKVRDDSGGWDYKRTCVEGPVFEAETIEW